ncbi:MAG: hypothetical protein IPK28_02605, partial [Devosia sp.]|nr:hypothetical protein [Devosia sp.]
MNIDVHLLTGDGAQVAAFASLPNPGIASAVEAGLLPADKLRRIQAIRPAVGSWQNRGRDQRCLALAGGSVG